MHPVVALSGGYAALLVTVAGALEWLARHTAARSERYRTAGFTYQPDRDLWTCPRDEPLWPYEVDRQHRLVRYRARPTVCNACPVKSACTTSHEGREIVRPIDPWPHSEAGRFHRGVSVTLTVLALAFLGSAGIAHHRPGDLAIVLPAAAVTGWLLWRWALDLRRTPSGFPEPATVRRPDKPDPVPRQPADTAGPSPVEWIPPSRQRTVWRSDRQRGAGRYRSARRRAAGTDDEEQPS